MLHKIAFQLDAYQPPVDHISEGGGSTPSMQSLLHANSPPCNPPPPFMQMPLHADPLPRQIPSLPRQTPPPPSQGRTPSLPRQTPLSTEWHMPVKTLPSLLRCAMRTVKNSSKVKLHYNLLEYYFKKYRRNVPRKVTKSLQQGSDSGRSK